MLSNRIQKIKPSATLAINAKAIELKAQGKDILKFGTGEPDFDTPDHIKDAAKKALDDGFTKYTAATGITELKEAVCRKFKEDNNIEYKAENVIISNGGKQALFNAFMAILNSGDEVIVPSPYWVSYADMVHVCDGEIITVDTTQNNFKLTAEMVAPAVTDRTKAIILNSPSNPTGYMIEEEEMRKIADMALKYNFYIFSDEVYEYFVYDGKKMFSPASISEEIKNITFTFNAVSKSYAMSGWRIGYVAGPLDVIKKMGSLQSHSTSNPCCIAQKAAVEALNGPKDSVNEMAKAFAKRRDFVYEEMNTIPGWKLGKPEGAFYAFPDVSGAFTDEINDSFKFTEYLLEKTGVAVVPGGAFGSEGDKCIRFSYASSMEDIKEGLRRIKELMS